MQNFAKIFLALWNIPTKFHLNILTNDLQGEVVSIYKCPSIVYQSRLIQNPSMQSSNENESSEVYVTQEW